MEGRKEEGREGGREERRKERRKEGRLEVYKLGRAGNRAVF